jgi:general secretion pathway protein J
MIKRREQDAFTLIELLVAMAIFAIMATLTYSVLGQTISNAEMLGDRMDRLRAVQKTVRVLSEDFMQLSPRPVRQELGDSVSAALSTDYQSPYAIELTRGGWNNPLVLPRSTLQRAAYRLEADELIRYHWNVLDRTLANEPVSVVLLDEVESIVFRFYPASGQPVEEWPPQNAPGAQGARQRPRAVEIILSLSSEGEIRRLIEVAP